MSKYLRNNIGFRRVSAAQMASFYQSKSFMLGEILDGRRANSFSPTAREILLQYFSAMELLLHRVEKEFIACHDGVITDHAIERCKGNAQDFSTTLKAIIADNPDDFDPMIAGPWLAVSKEYASHMMDLASSLVRGEITTAFCSITAFALSYLNHVMFTLHELTCLVNKEDPCLYISEIEIRVQVRKAISLAAARMSIYNRLGLIEEGADLKVLCEVDNGNSPTDRGLLALRTILDSVSDYKLNVEE